MLNSKTAGRRRAKPVQSCVLAVVTDRQQWHAHTRLLDHDDRARLQVIRECREMGEQQGGLIRRPSSRAPVQQHQRRAGGLQAGEQLTEAGVSGYDDAVVVCGVMKDGDVRCVDGQRTSPACHEGQLTFTDGLGGIAQRLGDVLAF